MNEGPGHVPLHKIPDNMRKQLDWCHEVWKLKGFVTHTDHRSFIVSTSIIDDQFINYPQKTTINHY